MVNMWVNIIESIKFFTVLLIFLKEIKLYKEIIIAIVGLVHTRGCSKCDSNGTKVGAENGAKLEQNFYILPELG